MEKTADVLQAQAYGNNAYGKAALGYLALKQLLGDDAFRKSLHAFIDRWHGRLPSGSNFLMLLSFVIPEMLLAVALSVRLLRFLSSRRGREKIWPAVTLGVIGLLLASLAVQGAFYRTVQAYEQCVDGAQTAQAKADCESLRDSVVLGDILTLR